MTYCVSLGEEEQQEKSNLRKTIMQKNGVCFITAMIPQAGTTARKTVLELINVSDPKHSVVFLYIQILLHQNHKVLSKTSISRIVL